MVLSKLKDKMLLCWFFLGLSSVNAYTRISFFVNIENSSDPILQCKNTDTTLTTTDMAFRAGNEQESARRTEASARKYGQTSPGVYDKIQMKLHKQLFGERVDNEQTREPDTSNQHLQPLQAQPLGDLSEDYEEYEDNFHYPNGQALRGEMFNNKSAVHFPLRELIYRGNAALLETNDHMQTAINAFSILLYGNVADVERLPPDYVLRSARTIAMMRIAREKLAMLWNVFKGDRSTSEIKYEELEMYRPLFKYVNAREIGRLNLLDTKILNFIGTHADLDRHQVGVVASKYMMLNTKWSEVKYLNHMNNLLCGVPMVFMRRIPSEVYLQLSHQVFYHIRACDPLQRRFYLAMMTKTEALGKSYSWSARDVSRLGLLLAEVEGPDLAAINPESMTGITAQVMLEISATNLEYLTETQVSYLALKPLTIFARKVKAIEESPYDASAEPIPIFHWIHLFSTLFLTRYILM